MAEVCPAGALLSLQAAPPRCLPLPLPAVCVCPCVGAGSARGRNSSSHPSTAVCFACACAWLFGNCQIPQHLERMDWQSCSLEWAPNVAPWKNDTPTFSVWPHEAPTLLNPPLLPISIGLCGQLLQPDGLPVPPEAVWQAACRGRQARVQLPTLWQEVQIQGWPRLSRAVRTRGLGEPPGRLRSPRSGAIPPRGGLQSCRARGQDRAGQGRAGQGRCRRRASVVFSPKSPCTCVVPCSVGGGNRVHPPAPLQKCCLWEWSAAFPFSRAHRAVLQPTTHPCSAREKTQTSGCSLTSTSCSPVLRWQDLSLGSIPFCFVDPC